MSKTNLISEMFVRPQIEINESNKIFHLNPFDLRLLLVDNTQSGFLHIKPTNFIASSYMEKLRITLSRTLVYFYPVAGQLVTTRNEADQSCCVYVDCIKGPGARLIHAGAPGLSMIDVLMSYSDNSKVVRSFFDFGESSVNYDGHTRPLLSVQVTELKDGVFLGYCFNHSVIDGMSIFHFQRVWHHIFNEIFSPSTVLPRIEKPAFIQGRVFKIPHLNLDNLVIRSKFCEIELRDRLFQFSPQSLKKLKSMANSDQTSNNKTISTFMALIAFVWKCITRIRNLGSNEMTICALPVNLRPRFKPPLTNDYYGGYAVKARGSAKIVDLVHNNVGWAATLLQQAVESLNDKAAQELVSRAADKGVELVAPTQTSYSNNIMVGGSTTFPIGKVKFGLGKLVAFRGGSGNKVDGKIDVYSGTLDDGSVDLEICLAPHTMNALELDQEFMSFASINNGHWNLISKI